MKKLIGLFLLISLIISINTRLFDQEWSDTQKEVWKQINEYYELWAKGDTEAFLNYIHDDYCGWHYGSAVTQTKSLFKKVAKYYSSKYEIIFYELKPIDIKIHGDVAIVHYYFYYLAKDAEGEEDGAQSRWTDILLSEKDKWLLISDHGGEVKVK